MPGPPKNIDDYLSRVTPAQRSALQTLRKQILAIVPAAEECISYSMPAFREPGGPVFAGFLATKQGCSYFPFSGSTLDSIAAALSAYSRTKSGLHLDPAKGLPQALLRKLIAARRAEIASYSAAKKAPRTKKAKAATKKAPAKKAPAKKAPAKKAARLVKKQR
ncbi:MAG TPA: DUF1801 domain-containing protein [Polyangiaceae bacterium]|nr:DUF1801 domain-containing protein [Polyangiaceae bacterium]